LARNQLLEEVQGGWVLWLDAGEQLADGSARQLRAFVDESADAEKVYSVAVDIPPIGEDHSGQRALLPRLMVPHPGLRFRGRVRETLEPAMRSCGLRLAIAPGRIIRHVREHDRKRLAARAERNLRLVDLEQAAGATLPARLLIVRGEALSELGDRVGARESFLQALDRASPRSTAALEAYYGILVALDGDSSRSDWQIHVCLDGLDTFPDDAQLLCSLGSYLHARGRLDLAARAFRAAAFSGRIDERTWHLTEIHQIAAVCLGITQELQGHEDKAVCDLERALGAYPDSSRILRRLVELYVKQGLDEKATRLAETLWPDHVRTGAVRDAVKGACAAARSDWNSALEQLRRADASGFKSAFCLRWLCVTLLLSGQVEAAEPVLAAWLALEPDNPEARRYSEAIGTGCDPGSSQEARQFRIDAAKPGASAFPLHSPQKNAVDQP
jgi:tetratricopeptide (TPR) repeat protein